jgi:integrase
VYQLSIHVFPGGERVPMLQDAGGLPLFYPTLFTTAKLRNAGAAVNTIKNSLADILVLLRWEASVGRDLAAEFDQGKFPSLPDLLAMRDFASLDMREVGKVLGRPPKALESLPDARLAHVRPYPIVSRSQHYNRLSTIAEYLEFVASTVTQHRNAPQEAAQIARMASAIRKHRPRSRGRPQAGGSEERSPPPDLVHRFMAVAAVGHPDNPFRSPAVRLRNAVLFGLLRYTGMRRGELLSLKIDQFDLGEDARVWVRRNQDDPMDTRADQPVTKTKERPLPIPQELAQQVHHYIMEHRIKVAPARTHGYLLISHRKGKTYGRPLSISAVNNQILAKMRAVDSQFNRIHPHGFRHHFNYELSVGIDEHNVRVRRGSGDGHQEITEARELDVRAQLNGHNSRQSGAKYNERHVREVADRASRQLQADIAGRKPPQGKADD